MAVLILVLGPFSLSTVNYGVTFMFIIITLQQLCDIDDSNQVTSEQPSEDIDKKEGPPCNKRNLESDTKHSETENKNEDSNETNTESMGENITESNDNTSNCDTCNENRIYNIFKNLREKFIFNDSLEN